MLKAVPGTNDIFAQAREYPFREPVFRYIIQTAEEVLRGAGAQMIHTPIFEYLEVLQKGVGLTSDIVVKKEMYTFEDRGGRVLGLRPEPTASIVRAYNQHGMKVWPQPVRLFTWGPIFRAERQQKGRYKQFHQVDYEALGLCDPVLDAEAIALMVRIYKTLGLRNLEVKLGSVGDPEDRVRYNQYLRELFRPQAERLSEDSRVRLETNPMRILDSKSEQDQQIVAELQVRPMLDFLGEASRAFHEQVCSYLTRLGVEYSVDPSIVRGLDYYVRTAWEVHHAQIGAKSALGGGGRYDGLSEMLGGPPVPGVGFGIGIERVAIALEQEGVGIPADPSPTLYLAPLDEAARIEALALAEQLRPKVYVELGYVPRSPRKALEDALKKGAKYVGFLGEGERAKGVVTLKHLESGEQKELEPLQLHSLFEGPDPK
ncbi:MAG: histidine--tRNA ligase [Meiothermus sp.]|uniref:histidine--tRNA ligase n=1 Tax=Meiothermus sp. TaxID=1955249 RepID=UPI0025F537E8|nr:histidine--tRNA ligase [Meiothermus sp.]MCS7069061.1 histidine--tRNA ligase [Meiothermus sp.]MCX7600677.1 histidine--tRNA ligase [Meiothermus sp.]MDW8426317.1 histidine--tRNA ligase [Meiothermus sp.]